MRVHVVAGARGRVRLDSDRRLGRRPRRVPANVLMRLFEPFFTTKEAGSGFGLYLAHELIREQGGRLEASNAPGGGACFTIWLPAATEAALPAGGP